MKEAAINTQSLSNEPIKEIEERRAKIGIWRTSGLTML